MTTALLTPPEIVDATRREFFAALGAAGLLTACGSDPTDTGAIPGSGYPRDVTHERGVTRLERRPERIVLLSQYNELTALLGLGVAPTAFGVFGDIPGFVLDALAGLGAEPDRIDNASGVNLERLAAARPDVLVSDPDAFDQAAQQLPHIAPTVVIPGSGRGGWRANLRIVADVLAMADRAEQVIAETETLLGTAMGPGVAGRTFVTLIAYGGRLLVALDPTYPTNEFCVANGLRPLDEIAGLVAGAENPRFPALSNELIGRLAPADLLVVQGDQETVDGLVNTELTRSAVPAIAEGRYVTAVGDDNLALDAFGPVVVDVVAALLARAGDALRQGSR